MIQHTILFKVKSGISNEQINSALEHFADLKNKLPGMLSVISGECQFHDEKSIDFFESHVSHAITIDFENEKALKRFFDDPVTRFAKNAIIEITEGGYDNIVSLSQG